MVSLLSRKRKTVVVNDRMQSGYCYVLTAPTGRNFHSKFRPELAPKEMLALGVFGGKHMTDCRREFPGSNTPSPEVARKGREKFGWLLQS